ncbi:MAG: hypothetical protein AB7W59_00040 [Acidimicrobiia bacterium]
MEWITVLIILPFIIGMLGEMAKKLILRGKMPEAGWPGWRGVYYVTYRAHALAVGAGFGAGCAALGIPFPALFGGNVAGGALAGAFAGGVAMVAYAGIVKTIQAAVRQVGLRIGARETSVPPAPKAEDDEAA